MKKKKALVNLVIKLKDIDEALDPEEIQTLVYSVEKRTATKNLREWFKLIYQVVFGVENGPRIGFFVKFLDLRRQLD